LTENISEKVLYNILDGNFEGRRPLRGLQFKWDYNSKVNLKKWGKGMIWLRIGPNDTFPFSAVMSSHVSINGCWIIENLTECLLLKTTLPHVVH
jgi:hypothetical protein